MIKIAESFYKGHDTYVIYAEETSYGAGGTPASANQFGKVQNINVNMSNNFFKVSGLGLGRNINSSVLGPLDVSGSIEFNLSDPTALQYAIGERQGAGTLADPYEIAERENIGYAAGEIPSLAIEIGSEGGANDDVLTARGVCFNTMSLSASAGELVSVTMDYVAKTVASSTSLAAFTADAVKPFVFQEGSVNINGESAAMMSFVLNVENNLKADHRELGDREIKQPTTGLRRYNFTLTLRKKFDDAGSTLSPLELRELFFGAVASTSPATGGSATAVPVSLDIVEGASSGDRVLNIDLETCYFDSWSEPIPIEGGLIEVTVEGFGHSGLTDASDLIPIRWYTIA